jgi:hypothetical protein
MHLFLEAFRGRLAKILKLGFLSGFGDLAEFGSALLTESGISWILGVAGGAGVEYGMAAIHAEYGIGVVLIAALLADHWLSFE